MIVYANIVQPCWITLFLSEIFYFWTYWTIYSIYIIFFGNMQYNFTIVWTKNKVNLNRFPLISRIRCSLSYKLFSSHKNIFIFFAKGCLSDYVMMFFGTKEGNSFIFLECLCIPIVINGLMGWDCILPYVFVIFVEWFTKSARYDFQDKRWDSTR